jgi:hypothetical protein
MRPDEQALRAYLEGGMFQSGVDRGYWRLVSISWPFVVIAVRAAARANGPAEYGFRFECTNYPTSAPTAQPWDADRGAPLAANRWPGGKNRIPLAFNPGWQNGQSLYLPCDRLAIVGHDPWRTQHPAMLWSPAKGLVLYLGIIHELLNSNDYEGTRGG